MACVGGGAHAAIFPAAGTLVGCLVVVGFGLPVWSLGGWLPRERMRMPDLYVACRCPGNYHTGLVFFFTNLQLHAQLELAFKFKFETTFLLN
jgi:hypothetical protein